MGIRYYAYAFEHDQTERALADPRSVIGDDPLADAWGLEPHATVSSTTFEQSVPKRDLLYLDKAWHGLQLVTQPPLGEPARPAFRMFEGEVTMVDWGWEAFVRALTPLEVAVIAEDLRGLSDEEAADTIRGHLRGQERVLLETSYVVHFLRQARDFTAELAADGRGMVYLIG